MIIVGCDPEFYSPDVSCHLYDNDEEGEGYCSNIGVDGAGHPTYEFRPAPSTDPRVVWHRIGRLALSLYEELGPTEAAKLQAVPYVEHGSWELGFGGHIHFGGLPNDDCVLESTAVSLSATVGVVFQAVSYQPAAEYRRQYTSYGRPDDYRYARTNGLEWRYLDTFLGEPALALSVLQLSQIVLEAIVRCGVVIDVTDEEFFQLRNGRPFDAVMVRRAAAIVRRLAGWVGKEREAQEALSHPLNLWQLGKKTRPEGWLERWTRLPEIEKIEQTPKIVVGNDDFLDGLYEYEPARSLLIEIGRRTGKPVVLFGTATDSLCLDNITLPSNVDTIAELPISWERRGMYRGGGWDKWVQIGLPRPVRAKGAGEICRVLEALVNQLQEQEQESEDEQ